jgi:hypothetical protein
MTAQSEGEAPRGPNVLGISAFYPSVLAACFVLTIYLDEVVPVSLSIRAVVVAMSLTAVLVTVACLLFGDRRRGALVASATVGLALSFHQPFPAASFGLVALAVIADRLLASRTGRYVPKDVAILDRGLATFAVILLVVTLGQFAARGQLVSPGSADAERTSLKSGPDIWILLLDGYPRADILKVTYGIDNSPFLAELRELGLTVAARSRSNYLGTDMTLPSMFNLAPLDRLEPFSEGEFPLAAPAPARWLALQENRAFAILREHGYETVALGSGYSRTDIRSADRFIDVGTADDVEFHLLADSALREVVDAFAPTFATGEVRRRIEANLGALEGIAREPRDGPVFVFAHVPSPHAPAVFDSNGNTLPAAVEYLFHQPGPSEDPVRHRADYGANLAHLNQLVTRTTRDLIQATNGEAVVILMSDHGSRSRGNTGGLTPADLNERFGNFFAYYTPDDTELFGDTVTPVNVLATLFDHYLGTSLPRWPDTLEGFVGESYANPDE